MTRPAATSTALPTPTEILALANGLRPVLLHINRHMRGELVELKLSSSQASLLAVIRDVPGIGMGELAARERVSAPSMCVHIDRLETLGFVTRTRGEVDRRRVGLALTAEGGRVLRAARSRRTVWLAERLSRLTPAQRAVLTAALEPLAALVEDQ